MQTLKWEMQPEVSDKVSKLALSQIFCKKNNNNNNANNFGIGSVIPNQTLPFCTY